MYLFIFNYIFLHKSKTMGVSTFSSNNENHNSYLFSLLAPKLLSVMFFPTSATPRPHHHFSHAVIPPKSSLSSSVPSHWLSSPPSPSLPNQTSHSAIPNLVFVPLCQSIETAREVQSQCPCLDTDVTGEAVVRLGENPCSLSCSPQLLLPCRKEQSFYGCKSQSQLLIKG